MTEGADQPPDPAHIGIRAFGLVASPEGLSFEWTDRIPRARGLGSSAATIALGMVAAAKWTGQELELEDLLARGGPLEGHSDNLAACLAGGACLTWDGRIARIADSLPLGAVAVIPEEKVRTAEARLALPARDLARRRVVHGRAGCAARRRDRGRARRAPHRGARRPAARAVPAVGDPRRGARRAPGRRGRRDALRLGPDGDRLGRGAGSLRRRARGPVPRGGRDAARRLGRGRSLKLPWELELGEPFFAPFSKLVAPARLPDGTEAVVKIHVDDDVESVLEHEALRFWDGRGAVRLIDYDPETRAMLIERWFPGTKLGADYDDESLEAIAAALERLWRPPSADVQWRRLDDVAGAWVDELPRDWERHGRPYERRLLDEALDVLRTLRPHRRSSCCATRICTAATCSARSGSRGSRSTRSRSSPSAPTTLSPAVRDLDEDGRITLAQIGTASTSSASGSASTASGSGSGARQAPRLGHRWRVLRARGRGGAHVLGGRLSR